jgi:hypothetical protein
MWEVKKIVSKGDYNYALVPGHPNATVNGYVLEHRIHCENHLKRLLSKNEVVHHINGNKKDNRIENLQVLDAIEHVRLHGLMHGRLYLTLKCPWCLTLFEHPKNQSFLQKGGSYTCCSMKCRGKFSRKIQLEGKTHEVEKAISENLVREYRKYSLDNSEEIS